MDIHPSTPQKNIKKTNGSINLFGKIALAAETTRNNINQFIEQKVPIQAGLYKSILTGDRSSLSRDNLEYFKASGAIHLLAISGLHMGLLALVSTFCLTWLLTRSQWIILKIPVTKTAALISLLPLTAYALIAGFHTPAIRSLVMVAVFILALVTDRQWNILNNLAIAGLLLLIIEPSLLFTVSFQLSFAAVISIAMIPTDLSALLATNNDVNSVKSWLHTIKKWVLFSILISMAAAIGTAPILLWHFNRVSLLSAVSTLFIEPFLCFWALMLGLLSTLLIPWWEYGAAALLKFGAVGIDISTVIAKQMAALPFSSYWSPTPTIQQVLLYYTILGIALSLWHRKRKTTYLLIGTAFFIFISSTTKTLQESTVSILDVGQGSATVIQLPGNHTFLVDGGRKQRPNSTFNIGENIIAPFLWSKQISKIDGIIITHPHADHYNGLPFIIERFKPKRIWLNSLQGNEKEFAKVRQAANKYNVGLIVPQRNEAIYAEKEILLSVLDNFRRNEEYEQPGSKQSADSRENNRGMVISLQHGTIVFLITGDIEAEAEASLLKRSKSAIPFKLKATVMAAPHHGSITSSSTGFVQAVQAKYVTISASKHNKGHFPNTAVLSRYQASGATVLNTAEVGSIFFKTNGNNLTVSTFFPNGSLINIDEPNKSMTTKY